MRPATPVATTVAPLARLQYEDLVRRELAEDLGGAGDLTTDAIVKPDAQAEARIVVRGEGRLCGVEVAVSAFDILGGVRCEIAHPDGTDVGAGTAVARLEGSARSILSAERTCLNLLGHLSGVSTTARELTRLVDGYGARVVCTRKTTPGLRTLEKYAVRVGGASNHRFGLHDAVLIKDNHRLIAGGVEPAVRAARAAVGHMVRLEVEVDTLDELREALAGGVDAVLLDNMSIPDLEKAAELARGQASTEASGGITAETIREVAATGVDFISVGWITHSAPALDVGLDFTPR